VLTSMFVGSESTANVVNNRTGKDDSGRGEILRRRDPGRNEFATSRAAGFGMSLSGSDFRRAMGCFATGVTVITVDQDGEVHGMTANAFTSVSLDPVLVLVCVDQRARTHTHLYARKRFGVNVLRNDQQAISEYYARSTETPQHPEEAGARFDRTAHGTPLLHGALAYLECRMHSAQAAGDHTIFIAEVEEVVVRDGEPLLYFRSQYRDIEASKE
jgi:flavin reductase (DIM6/NTAB) family NADH-FMN oxidoreductase RutF